MKDIQKSPALKTHTKYEGQLTCMLMASFSACVVTGISLSLYLVFIQDYNAWGHKVYSSASNLDAGFFMGTILFTGFITLFGILFTSPGIVLIALPLSRYLIKTNREKFYEWILSYGVAGSVYSLLGILIATKLFLFIYPIVIPTSAVMGFFAWLYFWKCGKFSKFLRG